MHTKNKIEQRLAAGYKSQKLHISGERRCSPDFDASSMSKIGRESRDSDKLLARPDLIYVATSRECRRRIKVASVRPGATPRSFRVSFRAKIDDTACFPSLGLGPSRLLSRWNNAIYRKTRRLGKRKTRFLGANETSPLVQAAGELALDP